MLKTILLSLVISQIIILALITFVTLSFPSDMFTEAWYLCQSAGIWFTAAALGATGTKRR